MDRYAVVGNPVAHSLSPIIHAAFAAQTGQALEYGRLLAPLDGFAAAVTAFFESGGRGLNVTVPFKAEAAAWVDVLDPAAEAAGAVNTIVAGDDGYRGCNTDGAGLVRDLSRRCGVHLEGTRVLLLGAGGAARGVVGPLLQAGVAELVIANRTASRAEELAARQPPGAPVAAHGLAGISGAYDLVINATTVGMVEGDVPAFDGAVLRGAVCYDMVYVTGADALTGFCRWARDQGAARVVDGLGMLVEQAALAFELWRAILPDTASVLERLEQHRRRTPT